MAEKNAKTAKTKKTEPAKTKPVEKKPTEAVKTEKAAKPAAKAEVKKPAAKTEKVAKPAAKKTEVKAEKPTATKAAKKPAAKKPVDKAAQKALADHIYLYHEGSECKAYDWLGAHPATVGGKKGYTFRVWAPNAKSVSVIGEFNGWTRDKGVMKRMKADSEVWETFIAGADIYHSYKYSVESQSGDIKDKCDPYAFHAETRPQNASKLYPLDGCHKWTDAAWMKKRAEGSILEKPMSIYEMHLGSWKKVTNGADGQFYSYDMIGDELIPYLKETGFTHVEFMPVMEHPLDASWGYQVTGYFAATSRFGTPADLMRLIDRLHNAGIGVILDWVPAHFPRDGHGLVEFDGTGLYEGEDVLMREHPDWGTRIFDYSRTEVRAFLLSSANFWVEVFHADGIRIDAVASMLYLDYGRQDGQWRANKHGGKENLEAVAFLRKLSEVLLSAHPDVALIAEESTAWPMVTKPPHDGGLGFNFKWNMGWMNDMMHYVCLDPYFRQFNHKDITFSFMYAFSENFLLPVSHDEVVHGKRSLLDKMPGEYEQKFAGVRAFLLYMFAHPGKKLLFMGQEFGQFIEWNFENSLDWLLLDFDRHAKLKDYVSALNKFYKANPELWEIDYSWDGFEWICHDDFRANTVSFVRRDKKGRELLFVINFSPVNRDGYLVGVQRSGVYKEVFNTDSTAFGGEGVHLNTEPLYTYAVPQHERERSIRINLPPMGGVVLRLDRELKKDRKA